MLFKAAAAALIASVAAQGPPGPAPASQWYGLSPDDTVPGLVNIFKMLPTGQPTDAVASIVTSDREYPKTSTLHVSWNQPVAYFATGVGANYIEDAVYAVNLTSGQTIWKHTLPAGLYIDNLAFDYTEERLFSIAFDPNAAGGPAARIVEYDATTGNLTERVDISREIRGGFVFGGAFSICPSAKTMYVGVDARDGEFDDFVLTFDYTLGPIVPTGGKPLLFPIPSSLRAVCTGAALDGIFGATIQADSDARETALIGDINTQGREGLFFPRIKGDLPTYTARGEVPAFLSGLYAFHAGTILVPVYAPYQRGQPIPFGALWTVTLGPGGPGPARDTQVLTPINYYLAGAAGVPI